MFNFQMTRERKYILIGGAVLLLFGVLYRFYPTFHDVFSVSSEIAVKQQQVSKFQSLIMKKKELQKKRDVLEKRLKKLEGSLLSGSTASLAAVNLQDLIRKITNANNVEIDSIRVLNPRQQKDTNYTMIPVRFAIKSDIQQLKNVLFQIEKSPELLIIEELNIDSLARRTPGLIRANITVEGVRR